MKNLKLISKTQYLRAIVILPAMGLLALTGCANLDGTAGHQTGTTNHVAAYTERQESTAAPADQDPDPTYEWFY